MFSKISNLFIREGFNIAKVRKIFQITDIQLWKYQETC